MRPEIDEATRNDHVETSEILRLMMIGRLMLTAAALAATVGLAQGEETHAKRHHKAAPAAEKAAAVPAEEAPLPEKVQKWFGNSVDDILTGANKALDVDGKK